MFESLKKRISTFFKDDGDNVVKAAFYYLICQLLVNGIGFLTTPIFARLMDKAELGTVSNFLAWQGMMFPILTLNLRTTINKSKYDFTKDNYSYLLSILIFAEAVFLVFFLVVEVNSDFFVSFFKLEKEYIRFLLLYCMFYAAFEFQQLQYNIFKKYKVYVLYSVLYTFLSVLLSLLFVINMENRTKGRILGILLPLMLIGTLISINIIRKGKRFKFRYIKYGLKMSVPLIPSALSSTILSTSDRAIITQCCGPEQTAMYSIPYTVSSISSIITAALSQAWGPWMFDKLKEENYAEIKKYASYYSVLYSAIVTGLIFIAPEVLFVLGGEKYMDSVGAMPPVILGMSMGFFYTFYFNIEYFYGETYIISIGTFLAAVVNVVLNFILVPEYGYIAAAYTTLVGYAVMLLYHFLIVKFRLKKSYIFNNTFFFINLLVQGMIQVVAFLLYDNYIARYAIVLVYVAIIVVLLIKNKKQVISFIKKFRE